MTTLKKATRRNGVKRWQELKLAAKPQHQQTKLSTVQTSTLASVLWAVKRAQLAVSLLTVNSLVLLALRVDVLAAAQRKLLKAAFFPSGSIIMNYYDPYQVSQDPIWHRWVDGIVILVIGLAAGLVIAQGLMIQEVTTTTTEIIRTAPSGPQIESGVQSDIPPQIRIEEG